MEEKKQQGKKNTQRKAGQPGKTQMSQKTQGSKNVKRSSGLCPLSSKCGGCQWINKPYAEQLSAKETRVRKLMEPFCKPEKIIGMEQPTHYRNKVHAVFGEDRFHNPISGIYEEKSHRIVPVDSCLIENETADKIIVSIRGLLKSFRIRPYNEDTGYGLLRHVLVRVGHTSGQVMVVLVLASPIMPSKNNFVKALLALHPEITTIVINVNNRGTSMVLGEKEQVIYGKGTHDLAYRLTKAKLEELPQITGIFVSGAGLSGAAHAVDDAGLSGKVKVVGYDATDSNIPYLEKGTVQFLIDQGPYQQGYKSIQLLTDAIFQDRPVETSYCDTGIRIKCPYSCLPPND